MAKQSLIFAVTFVALFALTYVFMAAADALPEPVKTEPVETYQQPVYQQVVSPEAPVRVVAGKVGLDVSISNPDTTDVEALDNELLKGAIRYPTSALLGVDGTVLLYGHSSGLPIVHNQNFKAFNGIKNLKSGDTVSVYSAGQEYRYTVEEVVFAKALANTAEDVVELPTNGRYLKLITCNSFGSKADRYILTAVLEGVYPL